MSAPGNKAPRVRCAVLGSPIAHSLSPVLHRAAYAAIGWPGSYEAVEVTEAALPGFIDSLDQSWRGLSLTMPLKRAVLGLLDDLDPEAERAGAVNTVILDGSRRVGYNTDVPGAVAALGGIWSAGGAGFAPGTGFAGRAGALILGGGATAASVGLALADVGMRTVSLAVRTPARASETVDVLERAGLSVEVRSLDNLTALTDAQAASHEGIGLVASTIPASAQAGLVALIEGADVLFDVSYDPWPTPLARRAEALGVPVVDGLDLLAHQAVLQVGLMTGRRPEVSTLLEAGRHVLARGHH